MQIEGFLRFLHKRLTRFEPESDLSRLNGDPSDRHLSSPALLRAIEAALWAAQRSGGVIDPVILEPLRRAGYARSRVGARPASLTEALAVAPPRRPARPRTDPEWRRFRLRPEAGLIFRPAGAEIDLGGVGKGLAADLASERLRGYATHCVDAGGDLVLGGEDPLPRTVEVAHPLPGGERLRFELAAGAVATSGIATRIWETDSGYGHHLIDPSSGGPAWTGVIQATAIAEHALEAETLAKMAYLAGPEGAREVLAGSGGAIVLDDGSVERIGRPALWEPEPLEVAA